jgi:hypothetical protein
MRACRKIETVDDDRFALMLPALAGFDLDENPY